MLILFMICILFVVYVYLGYPLLLWLLTRKIENLYPLSNYQGDISIVMVVCNEAKNIREKIENIMQLNYQGGQLKLIIVDDASDDNTLELIAAAAFNGTLIKSKQRKGKAHGINLAMQQVTTELVTLIDCRQQLELNIINYLSSWFAQDPNMGAVSGELKFKPLNGNDFSASMDGYWRYEKFIRKSEAKLGSVVGVTGALYMLRTKTFLPMAEDTLLDDVLIPMISCAQGYQIGYDDRAIAWDLPSTSVLNEKARKIRTLSGNYQLLFRFPSWITPSGHPIWWQFFSHKIARLFVPFAIILSILCAIKLYLSGSAVAAIYLLLVFSSFLLIPLSQVFPRLLELKLLKLLQSFLLLNWFCFLAFYSYFFSTQVGSWKVNARDSL